MLEIPLDLSLDTDHKDGRFFETLPEKSFEFVPHRVASTVTFNLALVLLPAKVDPIPEE